MAKVPYMSEDDPNYAIDCICVDHKMHVCHPNDDVSCCGVKVLMKKPKMSDMLKYGATISCPKCDYYPWRH